MRLFVGTTVPGPCVAVIRRMAAVAFEDHRWKIAPERQWHVTSLFIGERSEEDLPSLMAALAMVAAATERFSLHHGELVTMPEQRPRMLWVRFRPQQELTSLHMALATALDAAPSEHRPYLPHITLARSKEVPDPVGSDLVLGSMPMHHLTLFRTVPHPDGSIHHAMAMWPLR